MYTQINADTNFKNPKLIMELSVDIRPVSHNTTSINDEIEQTWPVGGANRLANIESSQFDLSNKWHANHD